jgi:peptidoglycan/LPS O-acetylase OafA/YrhL
MAEPTPKFDPLKANAQDASPLNYYSADDKSRNVRGATCAARWGAGIAGALLACVAIFFFVADASEVWHPFLAPAVVAAAGCVLCLGIAAGLIGYHKEQKR